LRYLISPRIAASIISFPLLTAFFDLIGIIGGYLTGVLLLGTNGGTYFYRVQSSLNIVEVQVKENRKMSRIKMMFAPEIITMIVTTDKEGVAGRIIPVGRS
jgi:ABC-type transporter Mla maintaining outer membrane lipid asymmetry permease subunit MlaE